MKMEMYYVTAWTDKKGKITTAMFGVMAYSESDAKARFKKSHPACARVDAVQKK